MKFHTFKSDASHMGWTLALLARVMERLERSLGLWVYCVNVRPLKIQQNTAPPTPGVTFRKLTATELLQAAEDPDLDLDLDPQFIREATTRGDLAWGVLEHDRLVSYTWRASSQAPFMDGVWVRVPAPFQYGYKSYTLPSHRGRGLYPATGRVADQQSLELGYPAMLHLVDISNIASLRAANQLGSKTAGYAGYLKLFGRTLTFRSPGARSIGVELYLPKSAGALSDSQRPRLAPNRPLPVRFRSPDMSPWERFLFRPRRRIATDGPPSPD
jgi:hypothetical protein